MSDGWLAMGTLFDVELRVRRKEVAAATEWLAWCRDEIARLEKIYSRHDPASQISVLNRDLGGPDALRDGVRIDSELEAMLFDGIEVWEASGGAFDMTIGPLVDVWSRAGEAGEWPPLDSLRFAKARVGGNRLLLAGEGSLGLTSSGVRIDLDGISKGAVLDRLREHLSTVLPDVAALLSFGQSSILALGDPDGEGVSGGWRLEVRSRNSEGTRLARIRLRDQALSVSSSVGSLQEIGGERVSHVIDPRTGNPVPGIVEAVVVSDRAVIADGWSTAMLVLGAQKESLRLVERVDIDVYVVEKGGRSAETEGWNRLLIDSLED